MDKKPKQSLGRILYNNWYMLRKVSTLAPLYPVLMVVEGIFMGLMNAAVSFYSFQILNSVDSVGSFGKSALLIGTVALFYVIVYLFHGWYWQFFNPLLKKKIHLKMHGELFLHARRLDIACFDDPKFYNDFVWAMNESDSRAVRVMEDTGKVINRVIASLSIFGLMLAIDPVVFGILFLFALFSVTVGLWGKRIGFRHSEEGIPVWREFDYVSRVFRLPDYAKEMRMGQAEEIFLERYDRALEENIALDIRYGKKYLFSYGVCYSVLSKLSYFAIVAYMVFLLYRGDFLVGGFAAALGIVGKIRWLLMDLSERLVNFTEHSLHIERYLGFLRFRPSVIGKETEIPDFETLELRNVSFSYDYSGHPIYAVDDEKSEKDEPKEVLRNVNMTIRKGEKIAIVGYNGAGKTTLIKLILRLYDPTEGEILYNGRNIREFDPLAYREKIGVVFQDYRLFAATVAENVLKDVYTPQDRDRVLHALQSADFGEKLATLSEGINTPLTREFNENGTNLSGGEEQKVAIARVFAQDSSLVIMDEPSSALDPNAEYELNQSIFAQTREKTVIFISHRLSTTRTTDRIYMFDSGTLCEEGSHAQLLTKNGKYAEMFRLQSEKYNLGSQHGGELF